MSHLILQSVQIRTHTSHRTNKIVCYAFSALRLLFAYRSSSRCPPRSLLPQTIPTSSARRCLRGYARLAAGHAFPQAHSYARHRELVRVYPSFPCSIGVAPRSRRPPSEARFSTRRATTSAPALALATLHPSPAPYASVSLAHCPFFSARLLRQARLLLPRPRHCRRGCCICIGLCLPRVHRLVPFLLPFLHSSTLAVFSISCVVHGFRRFPLPVLAVARHVLGACTKDEAGAELC